MPHRAFAQFVGCFAIGRLLGTSIMVSQASGSSMRPTIMSGDVMVVLPVGGWIHHLWLGSQLDKLNGRVVTAAIGDGIAVCKRIASINSRPHAEPHLWVLGDNPPASQDSRDYGEIPFSCVRGVAVGIVWPPSAVRLLKPE
jgi:signal peptidase I